MSAELLFVCTSESKGTVKTSVGGARAVVSHGLEGDAHSGPWHRQVSLLADEDIETMRAQGLELEPGAFGENLVLVGLDLHAYGIGSRFQIGDVELEITQVGKVCHSRCNIYHRTGDCIMPRTGLFARVVHGGELKPGLAIQVLHTVARETIQAAVLTVSDTCFAGTAEDTAGPAVAARLTEALGAHVAWSGIEPDDKKRLSECLKDLTKRRVDLIFTVGGTGCAARDVTPEATRAVIDKEAPGLAEAMRAASLAITPHALLQRGIAGIRRQTLIVNLPGSPKAAVENLDVIVPALGHAARLLRGHTAHADPRRSEARVDLPVKSGAFQP